MTSHRPTYVFDSFALVSYFQVEAGASQVLTLLNSGSANEVRLCFSLMNAGEMYYLIYRRRGAVTADATLRVLRDLPMAMYPISENRVFAAANLKARYSISYADAFAAALALELEATLVTGDPEFRQLEPQLRVFWIPR